MKRIVLDYNYIKSLPITTNRIEVSWNKKMFFAKYSIVSYFCTSPEHKNLAYEHFSDVPVLSVTGIKGRWGVSPYPTILFFVLTRKDKKQEVLNSLKKHNDVTSKIDDLTTYNSKEQHRIIASLAINFLGKKKNSNMMYNDGSLLVRDDKNFGVLKSRKELVCLKIEVNEYMNLTAQTSSFSNPFNEKELYRHRNCAFQVAKDIDGEFWSGQSVKPIVIKNLKNGEYDLNKIFIQKKNFKDNKNNVPYWPYNVNDYTHGKLYVLWQVVESVNASFKDIIEISFCDKDIVLYDEYKTGKEMMSFIQESMSGKSIYIEDPFNVDASKELIKQFQNEAQSIVGNNLIFPKKPKGHEMVIKICEPKENNATQTHYAKSLNRMALCGNALQHIIFHGNEREDKIDKNKARRILIDLLVNDSLITRRMPQKLSKLVQCWEFYRYKINRGNVHGASLSVCDNDEIRIQEFGLSQNALGEDYYSFIQDHFYYNDPDMLNGNKDYKVMKKNGNVYLIIDTDEIPILDIQLIDAGYDKVVNEGETIAMFKRKKNAHEYLRGYIGFHLWKSDGLYGEPDGGFSYLSGTNSENMQIMPSTKMDKMPRVRHIFILHKEHTDMIEADIREITSMVRFGFGRWNELMTYPFPFKFLQEYLDDACEIAFSKHWNEITYKSDLI